MSFLFPSTPGILETSGLLDFIAEIHLVNGESMVI